MWIVIIGMAAVMMSQRWLPALLTLGSAYMGYKSSKDASKAQSQAVSAQQSQEANRQALAEKQMSFADRLLYGNGYRDETGAHSMPGSDGALAKADSWTNNYLNWLQNSPDITYNAQRSAMEGNIQSSMEQAARALGLRGLNTANVQSGAALKAMSGIGMARTGLLAQLEAGRHDRMGERLGMGTQLTQGLVDRAMNAQSAATGTAMNFQSQIPQMMMGQAQNYANQAAGYGALASAGLNYYMQPQAQVIAPTTVAQPAPAAPVMNQFYSFKPTLPGYQSKYRWGV